MANLVKKIYLIYLFFLVTSLLFFSYQFLINSISIEIFIKVIGFFIVSIFILSFSYKKSNRRFNTVIEGIGVNQKIAVPTLMFIFLGGFSIALAIIFIAFLEALGILFIVESVESLILNVLALLSFFWLAFILFMGWDFIKIACFVSQYSMIIEKKSSFLGNIKILFRKVNSLRDAFLGFITIDLVCRRFPKLARKYYKNLLFPVKIWSACLTLYDDKYIADSLEESFSYFKNKSFKTFYTAGLAPLFLPMIIVPVIFSLGIILSNLEYFTNLYCFVGNCFLVIIFFLIFMSLSFFFSYSIIISLESAYYVKILNDIKEGKIPDKLKQVDNRIKFIEEESLRKVSKLKGNFLDVFRIYF
jgi:hypothetical protein